MTIKTIGQPFGVLLDTPADGGGGGSVAPSGTVPSAGGSPSPAAEPSVYDVDDTSLIRVKGSDKPVKFGEHVKGFQAQFTKAAQRASQLEKQLQERDQRLKALEAQQQQAQQRGQGSNDDVYAALRQLPYLKGEDAVQLVQEIGSEIKQRDQVLLAALHKMQSMEKILNGLHENYSSTSFESKISKWLNEGGYPQEAADLAKEIYLAYEGDDLDNEFPRIFADRWNQVEKIVEARRQSKLRDARPKPFIPGRGGEAKPSKALEIKPASTSQEVADQLFGVFAESDT